MAAPSPSTSSDALFETESNTNRDACPEHKLYVAMIRRAIWDYVLYRDADAADKRAISEDAEGWLFYDGDEDLDSEGRVTFPYTCAILGLDPGMVRAGARRLCRDDLQKLNNNLKDD